MSPDLTFMRRRGIKSGLGRWHSLCFSVQWATQDRTRSNAAAVAVFDSTSMVDWNGSRRCSSIGSNDQLVLWTVR